jgi:hypothetical protein
VSTGNDDLETWKRQRTIELAYELADSGLYEDFTDVAYALQFERGLTTAQALIVDPEMRRALNERCANAREALAPVVATPEPVAVMAQQAEKEAPLPVPRPAPSFLRRAVSVLSRSNARAINAGDLNSAPS